MQPLQFLTFPSFENKLKLSVIVMLRLMFVLLLGFAGDLTILGSIQNYLSIVLQNYMPFPVPGYYKALF